MDEELLLEYVKSGEPAINLLLRAGKTSEDVEKFDTLFVEDDIPGILYRLMPLECVQIESDIIYSPSYISTTTNIDKFIDKVAGREIACLRINVPSPFRRISVLDVITGCNDEGEYILPRGLRLRVTAHYHFEAGKFADFLEMVDSYESPSTLRDIYHFVKIDLYDVQLE